MVIPNQLSHVGQDPIGFKKIVIELVFYKSFCFEIINEGKFYIDLSP